MVKFTTVAKLADDFSTSDKQSVLPIIVLGLISLAIPPIIILVGVAATVSLVILAVYIASNYGLIASIACCIVIPIISNVFMCCVNKTNVIQSEEESASKGQTQIMIFAWSFLGIFFSLLSYKHNFISLLP